MGLSSDSIAHYWTCWPRPQITLGTGICIYLMFLYRVAEHKSTKNSPFKPLYRKNPRLPTPLTELIDPDCYTGPEYAREMQETWRSTQQAVQSAQRNQKRQYDKRLKPISFKEGDRVYVYVPHKTTGKTRKLQQPFEGPFEILKDCNTNAKVRRIGSRR